MSAPIREPFQYRGGSPFGGIISQAATHHGAAAIYDRDLVTSPVPEDTDAMGAFLLVKENLVTENLLGVENLHVAKIPNCLEKIIFVEYENWAYIGHSRGFRP